MKSLHTAVGLISVLAGAPSLLAAGDFALAESTANDSMARSVSAAELAAAIAADAPKTPSGLFVPSTDASVKLKIGGFMQPRYYATNRGHIATSSTGFVHGFQVARTRLNFEGTPGVKDLTYKFEMNADPGTGLFALTDAYIRGTMGKGLTITGGQFKPAFSHEQTVADTRQLAVERSTTDAVFALTRVKGVMVEYQTDDITLSGTFSNGARTLNQTLLNTNKADAAVTGRLDVKLDGTWDQYKQMTSFRDAPSIAIIGLGAHSQWGGDSNFTNDIDFTTLTADVFVAGSGWNAYLAGFWRHTDNNIKNISPNDAAVLAEVGYFISDTVEPFLRYEHIFISDDYGANTKDLGIVTPGVNWYVVPRSHVAKLTVDTMITIGSQAESAGLIGTNTQTGLLAGQADPQIVFRVQFQVVF